MKSRVRLRLCSGGDHLVRGIAFTTLVAHSSLCMPLLAQTTTAAQAGRTVNRSQRFEVASVRLIQDRDKLPMQQQLFYMSPYGAGHFILRNATFTVLVTMAFDIQRAQIADQPAWFDSSSYDIEAMPAEGSVKNYEQLRPMLQQLLVDRFHLTFHQKTKIMRGYALVVAKNGPKLTSSKSVSPYGYLMRKRIAAQDATTGMLASMLWNPLEQPVVDETGIKGKYDFQLDFAPFDSTDTALPSIFTAVQEQLGLKLQKADVPVQMLVIDHVSRVPTAN